MSSDEHEAITNCPEDFADESQVASGEDEVFIDEGEEFVDERRDGINCLEVVINGLEDIADEGRAASNKGEDTSDEDGVFVYEAGDIGDESEGGSAEPEEVLEGKKVGVELEAPRFCLVWALV